MKIIIVPLAVAVAIAVPTMLGFIPAIIGIPAILLIIVMKDIIFSVFARGLPMAIISARMFGGLLWGVMKKGSNIVVSKFETQAGMIFSKAHGAFNAVDEGLVKLDGVPMGLTSEDVGFNIKPEHLYLIDELKKRGINSIKEIIDTNEYGQFQNFKDDSRIKDIKEKLTKETYEVLSRPVNLAGLNDFCRYTVESAHPFRQDANIKIGIAKGIPGGADKPKWLVYIGVMVLLVGIGVGILWMLTQGGGDQVVRIITENGGTSIIPA